MRRGVFMLTLACLAVPNVIAQNDGPGDVEGKLLALERIGKVQASQMKDLKMLDEILDDNFVAVDHNGALMNKSQLLAYIQGATSLRIVPGEMNVRLHGRCAMVTGVYQVEGIISGKTFVQRGRFIDTWIEKGGKWVEIASLSTPQP